MVRNWLIAAIGCVMAVSTLGCSCHKKPDDSSGTRGLNSMNGGMNSATQPTNSNATNRTNGPDATGAANR
jgi:hypothetical protein